jgi:polar amino acid transport system substrate-binding protein
MRFAGLHTIFYSFSMLFALCLHAVENHEIQILTEENFPLQFTRDNQPSGFAVELVQLVLDRSPLTGRVEIIPWARAYKIAQEEANTLLFSTRRSVDREDKFKWAAPVFSHGLIPTYEQSQAQNDMVFICRADGKITINSREQAKQYLVATLRGDYLTEYLSNSLAWPADKLVLTRDLDDVIKLLEASRVDMAVMENSDYESLLERWGFDVSHFVPCFTIKKPIIHLYFTFSLSTSDRLVTLFSETLESIYADGSYQAMYQKWFNEGGTADANAGKPLRYPHN